MSDHFVSGQTLRVMTRPEKFGTATFMTASRAAAVADRIATPGSVNAIAWQTLLDVYPLGMSPLGPPADPFRVPNVYSDPTGQAAAIMPFRYDGIRAYNYALRFAIYGGAEAAEDCAAHLEAWSHLTGWVTNPGDDTILAWDFTWPIYLAAASMIDGSAAMTPTLRANLKDATTRSLVVLAGNGTDTNNHGDWAVVFQMAAAAYTQNRVLFGAAITRWKAILEACVDGNGDLWQEIYRQGGGQGNGSSGLHYCAYALMAKTYAAELARANGVWLYDYVSPSGHTLGALWERIAAWTAAPATYPYNSSGGASGTPENLGGMEVLQALWPIENGATTLALRRPSFDRYGAPYTSVTHAGLPLRG